MTFSVLAKEDFESRFEAELRELSANIKEEIEFMEKDNLTVVWGGTLAILLSWLQRTPYNVTRIKHDVEAQIKRIGIYYMCIDDLLY